MKTTDRFFATFRKTSERHKMTSGERALATALAMLVCAGVWGQQTQVTNRYAMKLQENADGSWSLLKERNYRKILPDLDAIPDLLTPYTYQKDKLSGKLYNKVQTEEYVYKEHDGYSLKIAVDKAIGDGAAPVMFYCHGGGWSRGNFDAGRSLSKYMAQQHGITGVRVEYTLAPQPGANVQVSIQDVLDAVEYVRSHASELGVDPDRIGFQGTSAGAHLAACAALKYGKAKLFVGYSGIYDLTTAKITTRAKDPERIAYFGDLDKEYLKAASPYYMIPKKCPMHVMLVCGTGDITVECSQSEEFAYALKRHKAKVELDEYKYYDHNLTAKASDKMEEIFFKTAEFIAANL